jgi:hypothetical protein
MQYATVMLEGMKIAEAKTLLETIKADKHHKGCTCKASEKKCGKGCTHMNEELEHRTEKDIQLGKDESLMIEYPMKGMTYGEKKYGVYQYGTYPESSVLAGQTSRRFIDAFDTLEDAKKAFPSAEYHEGSLYEPPYLGHLPDTDEAKKMKEANEAVALPIVKAMGKDWFVDVRLEQVRNVKDPTDSIEFDDIEDDELSKLVGKIWADSSKTQESVDKDTEHWIKATLSNDEASSDQELVDHFMKEGGLSKEDAQAWVAKRGEYLKGVTESSGMNAKEYFEKLKGEGMKDEDAAQKVLSDVSGGIFDKSSEEYKKGAIQAAIKLFAKDWTKPPEGMKAIESKGDKMKRIVFESYDDMVEFFRKEFQKPDSVVKTKFRAVLSESLAPSDVSASVRQLKIDKAIAIAERDTVFESLKVVQNEMTSIKENYSKDALHFTAKNTDLTKKLAEARNRVRAFESSHLVTAKTISEQIKKIKTLEEAKSTLATATKTASDLSERITKVEQDIKDHDAKAQTVLEGVKKEFDTALVVLKAQHEKDLLAKYFETKMKISGLFQYLKEDANVSALLEHCKKEVEVDRLIENISGRVEDGILHSISPSEIVVGKATDPATAVLESRIASSLKSMGK